MGSPTADLQKSSFNQQNWLQAIYRNVFLSFTEELYQAAETMDAEISFVHGKNFHAHILIQGNLQINQNT